MVGLIAHLAHRMTREQLLHALLMAEARVHHRAQNVEPIGNARVPRQQLAQVQAGHLGLNRSIGTANLVRGLGLGVVGFEVRSPAVQPDDDQGGPLARRLFARLSPQLEQARKAQTRQPGNTTAQEFAACERSRDRVSLQAGLVERVHGGPRRIAVDCNYLYGARDTVWSLDPTE